jgi:hypothetical protein
MSRQKARLEAAQVAVQEEAQPVEGASRYGRDELIAMAGAFGVRPEVMAGALHLLDPARESFTREEVDEALRLFANRVISS